MQKTDVGGSLRLGHRGRAEGHYTQRKQGDQQCRGHRGRFSRQHQILDGLKERRKETTRWRTSISARSGHEIWKHNVEKCDVWIKETNSRIWPKRWKEGRPQCLRKYQWPRRHAKHRKPPPGSARPEVGRHKREGDALGQKQRGKKKLPEERTGRVR